MIGRILYREGVQGVLNYVFGKDGSIVLGYPNTCFETDLSPKFFTKLLHFQGQRHATQNRYVHITLNLPQGEQLDDTNFYKLAKDYMEHMGFGKQPYCVVRHGDTEHQHVHVVSTTVNESGTLMNMSNSYLRNVATQRFLEKRYGLSPSPPIKQKNHRELPLYRFPELQFKPEDAQGTKFYMQDVLNGLLQKHKLRSFAELNQLAKPYHIAVSTMTNKKGRIGVAYGIDNQNKYKTQFISGSIVHPNLSGPKLLAKFEKNSKAKLVPMHKKRLEKQLMTTLALFKNIRHDDFPDILKSYQNIDCELLYGKKNTLKDIVIYDKSGFVFGVLELSRDVDFLNHPKLMNGTSQETTVDAAGNQFVLEAGKLIKNAFYESYLNANKGTMLLSEFILTKKFKDILPFIARSERYSFLSHYSSKNGDNTLLTMLKNEFESKRQELHTTENNKEAKTLEERAALLERALEDKVFDTSETKRIPFYLMHGLGLTYRGGKVYYRGSNLHSKRLFLNNLKIPNVTDSYVSNGSIHQNIKVLALLLDSKTGDDIGMNATAFFLPLMMPELYGAMNVAYRTQFEECSLQAYVKTAERFHIPFEKSPMDYIQLFNAKGFYFEQKQDKLYVSSVYSKHPVSVPLQPKTQTYLKAFGNLDTLLNGQNKILDNLSEKGRGLFKNLWLSYLIDRQSYDRAAFMMVYEGVQPILKQEVLEHHQESGLRNKILEVTKKKVNAQQANLLRKSVYAFGAFLGGGYKEEEAFNGFKDELTDYSSRKGLFV